MSDDYVKKTEPFVIPRLIEQTRPYMASCEVIAWRYFPFSIECPDSEDFDIWEDYCERHFGPDGACTTKSDPMTLTIFPDRLWTYFDDTLYFREEDDLVAFRMGV
jgi:hypothetical protein